MLVLLFNEAQSTKNSAETRGTRGKGLGDVGWEFVEWGHSLSKVAVVFSSFFFCVCTCVFGCSISSRRARIFRKRARRVGWGQGGERRVSEIGVRAFFESVKCEGK